jgi:hypothetical protein
MAASLFAQMVMSGWVRVTVLGVSSKSSAGVMGDGGERAGNGGTCLNT